MKNLKILLGVFIVTFMLSKVGIYAYSTSVFNISSVKVGGADGSVYTSGARTKIKEGYQKLTGVSQNHTNEARLQYYSSATNSWVYGTTFWQTIKTGSTLTFLQEQATGFYPQIMLGDYRVRIREKSWHIKDGVVSAVYNPGN